MEVHCLIVVKESEGFDFKFLITSQRIEAVVHCCISWTSIVYLKHWYDNLTQNILAQVSGYQLKASYFLAVSLTQRADCFNCPLPLCFLLGMSASKYVYNQRQDLCDQLGGSVTLGWPRLAGVTLIRS